MIIFLYFYTFKNGYLHSYTFKVLGVHTQAQSYKAQQGNEYHKYHDNSYLLGKWGMYLEKGAGGGFWVLAISCCLHLVFAL